MILRIQITWQRFILITGTLLMLASCNTTKYVPEDAYLLDQYKLEVKGGNVDMKELDSYIRPKPNKKILGMKFYLWLYNLSGEKDSGWNRWLRKIGEPPVVHDPYDVEQNHKQIDLYMHSKGYYEAEVTDTVRIRKSEAKIEYKVRTGQPYRIRQLNYVFEDTTLRDLVLADTVNSIIQRGDLFDTDVLKEERNRIEGMLRDRGYYKFNRDYIYYEADSTVAPYKVDITLGIRKYILPTEDGFYYVVPHRKYIVEEVNIYPRYDTQRSMADPSTYRESLEKLEYRDFNFLYEGSLKSNPKVISQSIFVLPGEYYNASRVKESHNHLSSLRIYKMVNISFEEKEAIEPYRRESYPLICNVQLSPSNHQSYAVELEGTNSSGNFGVGGDLNYMHRNLFGGAEHFSVRLSGGLETIQKIGESGYGNMIEFGAESRLTLPQFLLPWKTTDFIRKFNPKTNISIGYNYQRRPDYTRSVFNTSFGYHWNANELVTHVVNPAEVNFVKMIDATEAFLDSIRDTYLEYSYEDRLILGPNYSWIFSNQNFSKHNDFVYIRSNLESAGLALKAFSQVANQPQDSGVYRVLGNEFAQYVKGDVDFRHYNIFTDKTSIVYRLFLGAAYPYGNSRAIPYEKQYFSGGANGVRAWQVRDLGPGSATGPSATVFPNQTGDIKLEANLEYRFKLFWLLEGSLFVDAGNIWLFNPDPGREETGFAWNRFYKEIAIGPGLGMRMDFSFFVFRVDIGFKLRDPAEPEGDRWLIVNGDYKKPTFNFAIGYPF